MGSYLVHSEHSEPSRYYRDLASAIRARLATLQDEEVINELYLLAAHYERLAEFADSVGSLEGLTWPDRRTRPTW
jgi:putative heme degradation protein